MAYRVKWLIVAVTVLFSVSTTEVSSIHTLASASHLPIIKSASLTPAGSASGSYERVTVTGASKVAPSGPKS